MIPAKTARCIFTRFYLVKVQCFEGIFARILSIVSILHRFKFLDVINQDVTPGGSDFKQAFDQNEVHIVEGLYLGFANRENQYPCQMGMLLQMTDA